MDNTSPLTTTARKDMMRSLHEPLRILSLDGGGVRGIGSLYILRELMRQVRRMQKGDNKLPLRPCDYFDLICGTSTGGLIAIMLGRLRYNVDQTIELYKALAEKVFTASSSNTDAKFDHKLLEEIIGDIIAKAPISAAQTLSRDEMMEDYSVDEEVGGCRTFVVAIRTRGGNQAVRLRTYGNDEAEPFEGKIWQAARATSAAPTFFSPIQITDIKYGDGGTGWNNPTREAIYEARLLCPNQPIGCLISLGTGEEPPIQLAEAENLPRPSFRSYVFNKVAPKQSFLVEVAKYCIESLTSCKTVHDDVLQNQDSDGIRGRYFRFNTPGMGGIGLEEWNKIPDMIALTETYMESPSTRDLKLQAALLLVCPRSSRLKGITTGPRASPGSERDCGGAILGARSSFSQTGATTSGTGPSIDAMSENPLSDFTGHILKRPVAALLHVATHFTHVSSLFKTLIRHGSSFDLLWVKINSVKVAFRMECANLLGFVNSPVRLSTLDSCDLMEAPDDDIPLRQRTTTATQKKLKNLLFLVEDKLVMLRRNQEYLRNLLQEEQTAQDFIRKDLEDCLCSAKDIALQLKKHNSCLTDLIETVRAETQNLPDSGFNNQESTAFASKLPPHRINQRLQGFQIVQKTSTKLYEALSTICSAHQRHSAHFRLHPHYDRRDDRGNPYIQFELRFFSSQLSAFGVDLVPCAAWLAIESFFPRHLRQNQEEQGFQTPNNETSLKRRFAPPGCLDQSKRPKISQTQSTFSDSGYETSATSVSLKKIETWHSKPDFCLRKDFCNRFQQYGQDTSENPARFIGHFKEADEFNHRVSFSSLSVELGSEEPVSLANMFALLDIKRAATYISYIPYERVELAKQLASAMLQFQGTPLLKWDWSSRDIMFFGRYQSSVHEREVFKTPFLFVDIRDNHQERSTAASSPLPEAIVFNRCLLSLAITLIEIAYGAPFLELRDESELAGWEDGGEMDDHAILALAIRLQGSVIAELGRAYQIIVGKCLQACRDQKSQAFERSLRAEIFTEIVVELEELKQEMVDEQDENWRAKIIARSDT